MTKPLTKGSKVGERLGESRKGAVRDTGLGEVWRTHGRGRPEGQGGVIAEFLDYAEVGVDVRVVFHQIAVLGVDDRRQVTGFRSRRSTRFEGSMGV